MFFWLAKLVALAILYSGITKGIAITAGLVATVGTTVTGALAIAAGTAYAGITHLQLKSKNRRGDYKHRLIHAFSDLAVTNWTSPDDWTPPKNWTFSDSWTEGVKVEQSLVFYQDPTDAIIVSSRTLPLSPKWITVNITEQLERSNSSIRPRMGTPMAATASPGSPFEVILYFFNNYNKTVEIRSKDHKLQRWVPSDLGYQSNSTNRTYAVDYSNIGNLTSMGNLTNIGNLTGMGDLTSISNLTSMGNLTGMSNITNQHTDYYSQLAAHWFQCFPYCENSTDGVDQSRIFFQKANRLGSAISLPWSKTNFSADMDPGSGIAVTPFMSAKGPTEMRLFYSNSSQLMMQKWRNETSWEFDDRFMASKRPKTYLGQTLAATTFPAIKPKFSYKPVPKGPAMFIMAFQMQKKCAVTATYWDPIRDEWHLDQRVKFHGGRKRPRFTRIAANHNGTFYGMRDGEIHEYQVDPKNPKELHHVSRVLMRNKAKGMDV